MLLKNEIIDIANKYAESSQTEYYSLQLLFVDKSKFVDGYWDVCFKVLDEHGHEIDGPLLVAINGENGQIYSMEELIMMQRTNQNVKVSNKPL